MNRQSLKLYLVTDALASQGRDVESIVLEAVRGGVTMVQLREKNLDTGAFVRRAICLKALLKHFAVPLIINDRVDVALASGADGVHIGQRDMAYQDARRLLGPDRIIGLSVENMDQVLAANALDVDYIGISPVFATPTKTDTAEPFGLEGLEAAVRISTHPAVAIGGMNFETAGKAAACGAAGIAVVSAIAGAVNPRNAALELLGIINDEYRGI